MNMEFLDLLMEKTGFPQEARAAYQEAAAKLDSAKMEEAIRHYYEVGFRLEEAQPLVEEMAQASGVSVYTVWGLFLALAAERAREDYIKAGISEDVFFATFSDLRYKTIECKHVKGVWGTFVAFWYNIFYQVKIVKLGRLEYEFIQYKGEEQTVAGVTVKPGDRVLNIHIPSSGEPFDEAARLASYQMAYEFEKARGHEGPLVCVCHSWLLYPGYREVLGEKSNIVGFMNDFTLTGTEESGFEDAWRVFGPAAEGPVEALPEETSMQRKFKKYMQAGGRHGCGRGVLVYDGEKLLKG